MNLRPLGTFVSDPDASEEVIPLSPHVIVYGNAGELTTVRTPQLNVWKKLFYDVHWKKLKKNSELALRPRPHQFYVGEPVLVYSPGNSAKIPWTTSHIVDIEPASNRVIVHRPDGRRLTVNAYNVCPLTLPSALVDHARFDVTRAGARVSVTVDGTAYSGLVLEERSGRLLVDWDVVRDRSWPREWVVASEVAMV